MAKKSAKEKAVTTPRIDLYPLIILALGVFFWMLFAKLQLFEPSNQRIVGVDPVGYYAWVHSIFWDGDLDFENEYQTLRDANIAIGDVSTDPNGPRSATGKLGNMFSMGPSLMWAPFLLGAHFVAEQKDGYAQPYHSAVFIANAFYGILGVLLIYYLLKTWFDRAIALIASLAAWLATSAFYYTYGQEAVSHTCSLFTVALFLLLWARLREKSGIWPWALMGAAVGLVSLVRWQDVIFVVAPTLDIFLRERHRAIPKIAAMAIASFVVFFPQMIGWKVLYGSFLTIPQGGAFMSWTRPGFITLLFSADHGLITWTPICALALLGLCIAPQRLRWVFACLLVALAIQIYVTACAGNIGWTFGMRRLVNCTPLFALGLAALIARLPLHRAITSTIFAIFATWNILFAMQYSGLINEYYVGEALESVATENKTTVDALIQTRKLPDGTPFNLEEFVPKHLFPKGGGPTFTQFVPDKLVVLEFLVYRLF